MLSLKPVVYKAYRRKDGLFSIKIRVTFQRKSRYFDTPMVAQAKQLTRNLDGIRDYRLCSAVCRLVDGYRDLLNQQATTIRTIDDVARIIGGEQRLPSVADYAVKLADSMAKANRLNTAANYRSATQRLTEFAPGLQFADVTVAWLRKYEQWLTGKMGARGVQLYMSCLRRVYNAAAEELNADGVERIKRSPFEFYHIPEPPATKKRALTAEQMRAIATYNGTDRQALFARDVFLLSFYFCGVNTVDLWSLDQLTDTHLSYNRSKTKGKRKDNAYMSIAINQLARPLVERYRCGNRFTFAADYSRPYNFNKAVNKGLKKVGEAVGIAGLQFYAARHTWATIARNECNVAMDDVAMALCHSQRTVTDIYIRRDYSRVDEANDQVLRYCFGDK